MALPPETATFWESVLQIPETKESVKYHAGENAFISSAGHKLVLKDQIPQGISFGLNEPGSEAAHYIDHYTKDALTFDYFQEYSDGMTRYEQRRLHEVIASKVPPKAGTILDMGCGNAWVAGYFLKKNISVVSADIGMTNIVKALQTYPSQNHFGLLADAFHLPIAENTFDVIIAAEIMEHVHDPALFMASLLRVLKPGGTLIITTPYHEKIEYSLCIHCNQATPRHAHLHSFHEKNIPPILPEGCNAEMDIFMNKFLLKSRSHIIFSKLPVKMWRAIDRFTDKFIPGALRLMITITKPR